jgi:hypothetical protein
MLLNFYLPETLKSVVHEVCKVKLGATLLVINWHSSILQNTAPPLPLHLSQKSIKILALKCLRVSQLVF